MAAVLLRRLYTSTFEEFWPTFPPALQAEVKQQMILCIEQEQNQSIRRKICESTAEFARNMMSKQ